MAGIWLAPELGSGIISRREMKTDTTDGSTMMVVTQRLIAKFLADMDYYWTEYHDALRDGYPEMARRNLDRYNRIGAAVKYLADRLNG